jgi:hypothetical protein
MCPVQQQISSSKIWQKHLNCDMCGDFIPQVWPIELQFYKLQDVRLSGRRENGGDCWSEIIRLSLLLMNCSADEIRTRKAGLKNCQQISGISSLVHISSLYVRYWEEKNSLVRNRLSITSIVQKPEIKRDWKVKWDEVPRYTPGAWGEN